MKVVIAEKPSVARDIARVLGCNKKQNGYIEGNGYQITWAFGHLVELARPEDMAEAWKPWVMNTLPMIPDQWQFKITQDGKGQFSTIKKLFSAADSIICATDAGREGEHIFRLIYQMTGCGKPFDRLWISSLTDDAIKDGFASLEPGTKYDRLAEAALLRSTSDWLVGLNATRGVSIHNDQLCTVGRVQTPTLAMLVNRHSDIASFKPETYFKVFANCDGFKAEYLSENRLSKIDAQAVIDDLKDTRELCVSQIEKKQTKRKAPGLFNLLNLQKEANQQFGMTAQETLQTAQALYETHKILSYPRTESQHMSTDMVSTLPGILSAVPDELAPFRAMAESRLSNGQPLGKTYVDDAKLTDHHAIIPTNKRAELSELKQRERDIYLLVCKKFLAIFLPENITEEAKATLTASDGKAFIVKGSITLQKGWKELYTQKETDKSLPPMDEQDVIPVDSFAPVELVTKPPEHFTESSLLTAMKTAGKVLDDRELSEYLKESGLGTAATRAGIIERLIKTGYVERSKKSLLPTPKGVELIAALDDTLKSPQLTAEWEQRLKQVEDGHLDSETFTASIAEYVGQMIKLIQTSPKLTAPQRTELGPCPICDNGTIIEGNKGYGCNQYKSGCNFVIWKEIASRKISIPEAQTLIKDGKTEPLKGFKSKAKKPFDAILTLDGSKVVFEFPERVVLGKCPKCKTGDIVENAKGYGCTEFKNGCDFILWKEVYKKKISIKDAQDLMSVGKTDLIKGFKDQKKHKFDGYIKLKEGKMTVERTIKRAATKKSRGLSR